MVVVVVVVVLSAEADAGGHRGERHSPYRDPCQTLEASYRRAKNGYNAWNVLRASKVLAATSREVCRNREVCSFFGSQQKSVKGIEQIREDAAESAAELGEEYARVRSGHDYSIRPVVGCSDRTRAFKGLVLSSCSSYSPPPHQLIISYTLSRDFTIFQASSLSLSGTQYLVDRTQHVSKPC